ncbi:hypothetical protein [Nonomuraea typhae]|nr:hypothetical protein [Nonomuraea typhae]
MIMVIVLIEIALALLGVWAIQRLTDSRTPTQERREFDYVP